MIIINLNKAKNKYYSMMSKLEGHISKIEENKQKLIKRNNSLSMSANPAVKTKKDKKEKKEEKI